MDVISYSNRALSLQLRMEIEASGFETDKFLSRWPDVSVFGLNLAIGWPLPRRVEKRYQMLAQGLSSIDPCLSVYPYRNTHITVATLVSFKNHENPSRQERRNIKTLAQKVAQRISELFEHHSGGRLKSFEIVIGEPILSRNAIFLPILNPTHEIDFIRRVARQELNELLDDDFRIPDGIHCTIARFRSQPAKSVPDFFQAFDQVATQFSLGRARIREFLLTTETKPYMRAGRRLHRFQL
jgi:hypothetical protein